MSLVNYTKKRVLHREDVKRFDEGLNFQILNHLFTLANLPSMDEIANSEETGADCWYFIPLCRFHLIVRVLEVNTPVTFHNRLFQK